MKKRIILILMFTILVTGLAGGETPLLFKWAFLVKKEGSDIEKVSEKNIIPLNKKDEFRFFYQPVKSCYFTIYYLSSGNDIFCLLKETPKTLKEGTALFIPNKEKSDWYQLKDTRGTETFFILAQKKPLNSLDKIYARYKDAKEKGKDLSKIRKKLIEALYRYADISGKGKGIKINSVPIMGVIKGPDNIKVLEIRAEESYGRIIKISHEGP